MTGWSVPASPPPRRAARPAVRAKGPGTCLRLWTAAEQRALPPREAPEVQRLDLAGAVLQLRAWGESDVAAFPWLEPPPVEALERAELLLRDLGAIDAGRLTADGEAMAARRGTRGWRGGGDGHRRATSTAPLPKPVAERDPSGDARDAGRGELARCPLHSERPRARRLCGRRRVRRRRRARLGELQPARPAGSSRPANSSPRWPREIGPRRPPAPANGSLGRALLAPSPPRRLRRRAPADLSSADPARREVGGPRRAVGRRERRPPRDLFLALDWRGRRAEAPRRGARPRLGDRRGNGAECKREEVRTTRPRPGVARRRRRYATSSWRERSAGAHGRRRRRAGRRASPTSAPRGCRRRGGGGFPPASAPRHGGRS